MTERDLFTDARAVPVWLVLFFGTLAWSGIAPKDRFTWLLEVLPALIALAVIAATRRRFPLTPLAYWLILIHSIILMIGGHYTYAEVPFFDRLREVFSWERNNYDKVGHFAQGFIPAIISREVLVRLRVVNGRRWLAFLVLSVCLAVSALYELFEWWTAALTGEAAEAFLGTQGYAWDTQSDMAFCLAGAVLALLTLSRLHDRQLAVRGSAPA
jgi:putative membrane protein